MAVGHLTGQWIISYINKIYSQEQLLQNNQGISLSF